MGEAKRRADLGPTRRIRFASYELMDLVRYLVPQQPQPGQQSKKINRDQRRALRSALEQLGILEIWHRAKSGPVEDKEIPKTQVKELTVDAIQTLLTTLNGAEMDYLDTLNIGDIEDRLEDAKAGLYVLDEEEDPPAADSKPDADAPAPETAAAPEAEPTAPPVALTSV